VLPLTSRHAGQRVARAESTSEHALHVPRHDRFRRDGRRSPRGEPATSRLRLWLSGRSCSSNHPGPRGQPASSGHDGPGKPSRCPVGRSIASMAVTDRSGPTTIPGPETASSLPAPKATAATGSSGRRSRWAVDQARARGRTPPGVTTLPWTALPSGSGWRVRMPRLVASSRRLQRPAGSSSKSRSLTMAPPGSRRTARHRSPRRPSATDQRTSPLPCRGSRPARRSGVRVCRRLTRGSLTSKRVARDRSRWLVACRQDTVHSGGRPRRGHRRGLRRLRRTRVRRTWRRP
jgi:hypothetical protein